MFRSTLLVFGLLATGCQTEWKQVDADGDGYRSDDPENPDCWDAEGPIPGTSLTGADVYAGATETWYDGVDQDCKGDDDYDADGDGYVADEYAGLPTLNAPGVRAGQGGDCWDDPSQVPAPFRVVEGVDAVGNTLTWTQPSAADVHTGATETWYDGVDADCSVLTSAIMATGIDTAAWDAVLVSEFDQDGDSYLSDDFPHFAMAGDTSTAQGDDCIDDPATDVGLDEVNNAGSTAEEVHPGATESWYDGTDQDCDDNDCDADGDDHPAPMSEWCTLAEDCDDTDPGLYYDPSKTEIWYNGEDENCDTNDGDKDGDGWWAADYAERVAAAGGTPLDIPPADGEGDCWDDLEDAALFTPLNGLPALSPEDVYPGAAVDTSYDGIDQDCAGDSDFDQDGDGFDTDAWPQGDGSVGNDCLDEGVSEAGKAADNVFPGQIESWYDGTDDDCDGNDGDRDGDGYYWDDYPYEVPADYLTGDCDDSVGKKSVNPGETEDCNTTDDDDCSGSVNDVNADNCTVWYADTDRDGFGNVASTSCTCTAVGSFDCLDATDCNDADADTWPGADEYCDGHDDDCDGTTDEDSAVDALTWYRDADTDSYGDPAVTDVECYVPTGYVADHTDCDDARDDVNPGANEVCDDVDYDEDCDGVADESDAGTLSSTKVRYYYDADLDGYADDDDAGTLYCDDDAPAHWYQTRGDCDDTDADTNPSASEYCDGHDDDCDGTTDEASAVDASTWYQDADADSYGNAAVSVVQCYEPSGYGPDSTDCDDGDAGRNPGLAEVCDTSDKDEDCDSLSDDDDTSASGQVAHYKDVDNDTYGDASDAGRMLCDSDGTHEVTNNSDCNDGASAINPAATETIADGIDYNCDAYETCYVDADDDNYRTTSTTSTTDTTCTGSGHALSTAGTDCLDSNANAYPGAAESESSTSCMEDADGDGYGDKSPPSGVTAGTDCDDSSTTYTPAATEVAGDELDYNCDGKEICYRDSDSDGYGTTTTVVSTNTSCRDANESRYSTDCADSNANAFPGSAEMDSTSDCMEDADADGYGDTSPPSGVTYGSDCNDTSSSVHPGATETVGNGVDENCDSYETCYADADFDGARSSTTTVSVDADCTDDGEALSTAVTDCLDSNGNAFPGAAELESTSTCMEDADADGYGDASPPSGVTAGTDCADSNAYAFPGSAEKESTSSCREDVDGDGYGDKSPPSGVTAGGDCDDSSTTYNPGATEVAGDELDYNCDTKETCYTDADSDGYGSTTTLTSSNTSCRDSGESRYNTDCADSNAYAFPGSGELDSTTACTEDADGDGYGDAVPPALVTAGSDCNDSSAAIKPGATETTGDAVDYNCDGKETCYADADLDAYRSSSATVTSTDTDCSDAGEALATATTDCLDSNAYAFPGAAESESSTTCMEDADSDGYGDKSPPSGVNAGTDCNDASSSIKPSATETTGDGVDYNCDGAETCYADADSDGYRSSSATVSSSDTDCIDTGEALSTVTTDCLDSNGNAYPGAAESESSTTCMEDADADGYGDKTPPSGVTAGTDCNDASSSIKPGATETTGDAVDYNCDGAETCYADADHDNYRSSSATVSSTDTDCSDTGEALATATTDCLDSNAYAFPGAAESESATTCMEDADADGYGDKTPPSGVTAGTDCNDASSSIKPGATETVGDAVDQNCDGTETCYADADGDAYRSSSATVSSTDSDCSDSGEALAAAGTDCLDSNGFAFPGAAETESTTVCMEDADSDGYGDKTPPSGVTAGTDCNDASASIKPGATEITGDEVDQNCDGAETCYKDLDGDTYGTTSTKASTDTDCDDTQESVSSSDCLDTGSGAASVFPGAAEAESSTSCMKDADGDGYGDLYAASGITLGIDCDDTSTTGELDNEEDDDADDIIDEDCRAEGDLVVTEFMYYAVAGGADPYADWIEIYNTTDETIYADGLEVISTLSGGTRSFVVGIDGLVIPAGDYAVLCHDKSKVKTAVGADLCDYEWGFNVNGTSLAGATYNATFYLGYNAGTGYPSLELLVDGFTLDVVDYLVSSPWPTKSVGFSDELSRSRLDETSNDSGANWCLAAAAPTYTYSATGPVTLSGTPNSVNTCAK